MSEEQPAFEVRVGLRHYRIWTDGRTDGFKEGEQPVLIVNRIPLKTRLADMQRPSDPPRR